MAEGHIECAIVQPGRWGDGQVVVKRSGYVVKPDAGVGDCGSVVGTARLDEEDLGTGRGQFSGQDRAGRTCSDDDVVVSLLFVQCVVHVATRRVPKSNLSDGGPIMPQLYWLTDLRGANQANLVGNRGEKKGLDLDFFSGRIAVEPSCAAGFERPCRAIAVLEKLDISNLVPLETRQEGKWRGDLPPPATFDLYLKEPNMAKPGSPARWRR